MSFVYPIPGLLPEGLVVELRDRLTATDAPWVDGRGTAGRLASRKSNQELDLSSALRQEVSAAIHQALADTRRPEALLFQYFAEPVKVSPCLISRTPTGGGYGDHIDNAYMSARTPSEMRSDMSMTIFLSDRESYDGGGLVIDGDLPYAPAFEMPAGGAVLYATTSVHRVNEVKRGERLAAVTWIESRIADPLIRETNGDILQCLNLLTTGFEQDDARIQQMITKLEKVRGNLLKSLG